MKVTYELEMVSSCPADGLPDVYHVIVEAERAIPAERVKLVVEEVAAIQQYQEKHTEMLARLLAARVTTIGYHYGVKTTCSA